MTKSVKKMNLILFIENEKWILNDITRSLIDQFQQKQDINSGISMNTITTLLRFRRGNHKVPVETGRRNNVPGNQRFCNLCKNDIVDEYYYR